MRRFRTARLLAWLVAIVAAVVAGGWIVFSNGPPSEAELREQARLIGKDRLRVGVKHDTPGIALRDAATGKFKGFDIEIAYLIAADLGFLPDQVEFLSIETEDRARMRAKDRNGAFVTVDLVVATFSVTDDRTKDTSVGLSTPYLETEQSVITRAGHPPVTSLSQLRGKQVCTLGTSTSSGPLKDARAEVTGVNQIKQCVDGLLGGTYEAVSTDAGILAGFVTASDGKLLHHDIGLETREKWAVNTGTNTALGTLVELALHRSYADPQDRRWEEAYQANITPLVATNPDVDIAAEQQPCVNAPDVRRLPWERGISTPDCQRPRPGPAG
ncbi:transporter substrate-binding domain-containing protein [Streptosporangium soli]|nr:transporter substrate-binding domain-containing protein [Streptosporangium sp. KLBMP 9127]